MTAVEILGERDILSPENEKYADGLRAAEKAFNEALEIFNAPGFATKEGWKRESDTSSKDSIYSKDTSEGKLFALEYELAADVETIFHDQWDDFENSPEWNREMAFAKVVAKLCDRADVVHYGSDDLFIVKGRDFVAARLYRKLSGGGYMVAVRSFDYPGIPETKQHVRGELRFGVCQFLPKKSDPNATVVRYLMCFDLKGLLPRAIINQVTGKLMMGNVVINKKRAAELRARANHGRNDVNMTS